MVIYLGGKNEKFGGLLKAIRDAYDEVMHVTDFAHAMVSLSTNAKVDQLGIDTARIVQREYPRGSQFDISIRKKNQC